jgi:hypothetical protein
MGDDLEMAGLDAPPMPTDVIWFVTCRNSALGKVVGKAVRGKILTEHLEMPIPV